MSVKSCVGNAGKYLYIILHVRHPRRDIAESTLQARLTDASARSLVFPIHFLIKISKKSDRA